MAVRYCSQCGTPQPLGARFCGSCGTPLGAGVVATASISDTTDAHEPGYAGFWLRLLALFIDAVVVWMVTSPISFLVAGEVIEVETVENVRGELESFSIDFDWTRLGIAIAVSTVLTAAYYIIAFSRWGQTLGALAVSVRVQHPDGSLLSPGAAAARRVGSFISAIPLYLGYVWMIWDRRKRTWHDTFAGSVVVKVKRRGEL